MILSGIKSPEDLKDIPESKLGTLSEEIRRKILEVVAKNGGHLASNLGIVELTIALHRVFNSPEDAIVFDVSHQCYAHKLLTGRYKEFDSLRQHGGMSGFTRHEESVHDFFDNGHASTSISQALGLLTAWEQTGHDGKVVAVIGDGALTGGLALEALCHAGQLSKNLIVVLNDNQMSISPNTGALSRYLSRLTVTGTYQNFRNHVDRIVNKIPYAEHHLGKFIFRVKRCIKGLLLTNNLFVDLGFEYVGPLSGHDIHELELVLRRAKRVPRPVVIHIVTKKGKGYSPAENNPSAFHGVGPFQISDGTVEKFDSLSFTQAFNQNIMALAEKHSNLACITAAMSKGTGLDTFARHYPDRFFDVGIAEEHAVTFASGLAKGGMIPVVAIYSTFIQRSVDQIIHDVALPGLHVIFALDRAGVVPADGETHQGLFDMALLRTVPGIQILSPATAVELKLCMEWAVNASGPVVVRYPKITCPSELDVFTEPLSEGRGLLVKCSSFDSALSAQFDLPGKDEYKGKKLLFVCTGGIYGEVVQAARSLLLKEVYADIYNLRFIKPLDEDYFAGVAMEYDGVIFVEDGIADGSVSAYLQNVLFSRGYTNTCVKAFDTAFCHHGSRSQVMEEYHMSPKDFAEGALKLL